MRADRPTTGPWPLLAATLALAACATTGTATDEAAFDPEAVTDRIQQDRENATRRHVTRAEQLEAFLHSRTEDECWLSLATEAEPVQRSCSALNVRANGDEGIVFFDDEGRVAAWVSERDLNRAFVDYHAPADTPDGVGLYELALPPTLVIGLPGADSAKGVLLSEAVRGRSSAFVAPRLTTASTDVELALIDGLAKNVVMTVPQGRSLSGRLVDVRNDSVALMTSDFVVVVVQRASIVAVAPTAAPMAQGSSASSKPRLTSADPFAGRDAPSMERFYELLTKAEAAEGSGKLAEAASLFTRAYDALPSAQRVSELGTDVVHAAAVVSRDQYFQDPSDPSVLTPCATLVRRHLQEVRRAAPERDVSDLERLLSSVRTLQKLGPPD